ncbi:MAG: ferritin-like domain-containing protein [Thermoleophilia bacterium]
MDGPSWLAEMDRDGAIEEAAAAVDGSTRRTLLRRAAAIGGGAIGGAALLGAAAGTAGAAAEPPREARTLSATGLPASDVAILNFALTLEYLENAFYYEAEQSGALRGETLRFAQVVGNHERSHVLFLEGILGDSAVARPRFDFKGTTQEQGAFQATADVLENTGVHAYLGQAGRIKTKAVLAGAAAILPVEARHAAWIRDIRFSGGTDPASTPAPAAFEDGFGRQQILDIVASTGFIVG